MNIARTTLSSKLLTQHKDHFARLAVQAVLRLKGSGNLEAIQIIKKLGGEMSDSYLEEGGYYIDIYIYMYLSLHIHPHCQAHTFTHTHTHSPPHTPRVPTREEGGCQPAQEIGECSYTHC